MIKLLGSRLFYLLVFLISVVVLVLWFRMGNIQTLSDNLHSRNKSEIKQRNIPEAAYQVLNFVLINGSSPEGYIGGKTFYNREKRLPREDLNGTKISYKEWDIYPKIPGKSRGPERLVTGDDGSAWYTADHYITFIQIEKK